VSIKFKILSALLILFTFFSIGFVKDMDKEKLQKITTNDKYNNIAINNILMYQSNNGDGSHNNVTDGSGLFWPGGAEATKSAVFEDGFIWGGKVDGETRVGGSTYRSGLQAGKILPSGLSDDPILEKYRVFKIKKNWEDIEDEEIRAGYEKDYNEWSVVDGAPWVDVDNDGVYTVGVDKPKHVGDETLWFVANDLDSDRTKFLYGTNPIGLEMQCTIFGYNQHGDLGDVLYKKYLIINKGDNTVNDMILGYWADVDLGNGGDDYSGCDTTLALGYTYNGSNNDLTYGEAPPAIGYSLLQGPKVPATSMDSALFMGKWYQGYKNLDLSAFTMYINGDVTYQDPELGTAEGGEQMYRYLSGRLWNDDPFIDPNSGEIGKYVASGDPVNGVGWYEGLGWPDGPSPGDRRQLMSFGEITLAPGDSQEVVLAIVIKRGNSNYNSVKKIKETSEQLKLDWQNQAPSAIAEDNSSIITDYDLKQNYPNPFNPRTNISFSLPRNGYTTLKVYDLSGREVATLVDGYRYKGDFYEIFDGSNLASGVYVYKLQSGEYSSFKKMLLIK